MNAWRRLFVEHPASVDESYTEHLGQATSFGVRMIGAGLCCLIHGLVPGLFKTRGSDEIRCLYDRMVVNRRRRQLPANLSPAQH
jgi:hypothetical protein